MHSSATLLVLLGPAAAMRSLSEQPCAASTGQYCNGATVLECTNMDDELMNFGGAIAGAYTGGGGGTNSCPWACSAAGEFGYPFMGKLMCMQAPPGTWSAALDNAYYPCENAQAAVDRGEAE